MRLAAYGLVAQIPQGWDARIYRRSAEDEPEATTRSILHAASFPLPLDRGDFGSGAVEVMGSNDVFLSLVEFDREAAHTPLFSRQGMPEALDASQFSPNRLQRAIPGQAGTQVFFTQSDRAYCLYVVLGGFANRIALVPAANELLASVKIRPDIGLDDGPGPQPPRLLPTTSEWLPQ